MKAQIPENITKVENKVLFGLTSRQILFFSLGILFALPVFFLGKKLFSVTVASTLSVFLLLPFFLFATFEKNGRHLEEIIWDIVRWEKLRPKERPYQSQCIYALALRQRNLERRIRALWKK